MTKFSSFLFSSVSAASMLAWAPAMAQSSAAAPQDDATANPDDEIVVTATKRSVSERAQDVGLSVTAVGMAQIANAMARDIQDVGRLAPSVRLIQGGSIPGVANFEMRGMGGNSTVASDEPTVGLIVNGIYYASNYGSQVDAFDLESVQILRGPQGTLLGRNVTGGAVVVETRKPGRVFGVEAEGTLGNGGTKKLAGAIDLPLGTNLFARVAAKGEWVDGFYNNIATGDEIDGYRSYWVRPSLLWTSDGGASALLQAEYSDLHGGGPVNVKLNANTAFFNTQKALYGLTTITAPDFDEVSADSAAKTRQKIGAVALNINIPVGPGTLTSSSTFRDVRAKVRGFDIDGTLLPLNKSDATTRQRQWGQELRYAFQAFDDRLSATFGGSYFRSNLRNSEFRTYYYGGPASPGPTLASSTASEGVQKSDAYALFGEADFAIVPTLKLTVGGRYSRETKEISLGRGYAPTGTCTLATETCVPTFFDKHTWSNFSPKAALSWKVTPDILLYSSYTKGFRSGGYNIRTQSVVTSPGPYNPEKVAAFEVGAKTEWLDDHVRLNIAAFSNKYDDLQRVVLDANLLQRTINAASATIRGIEVDATVKPVAGFSFGLTGAYLDAHYNSFDASIVGATGTITGAQVKDLAVERAPEWSGTLWSEYTIDLASGQNLFGRVSYSYTDKMPVDTANDFFLDSYGLLDATLAWSSANKKVRISAYGHNLTDKRWATAGYYSGSLGSTIYLSAPRSYGLQLSVKY
jgi:outer membrane receptor protein involved in Fe transport